MAVPKGPGKLADKTAVLVAFFVGAYITSFLLRGIAVMLIPSESPTAGLVIDGLSVIVFGPAFIALVLTGLYAGTAGVRQLLVALLPRRSGWPWYLLAFLIPITTVYLALGINVARGVPFPNLLFPTSWVFLLGFLVFQLLLLAPAEEIGWRGFALPRLQKRLGSLGGTLLLAALWLGWETPLFFKFGTAQLGSTVVVYALALLAWSLIMTWLYNSSGGSTLTAVLFHTSFNVVGYALPFAGGLTVLFVLLLLGCGVILLYPRPLLQTSEETQDSITEAEAADIETAHKNTVNIEAVDEETAGEVGSDDKTKQQRRESTEGRARETLYYSDYGNKIPGTYEGSGGTAKDSEEAWEGLTEALRDAVESIQKGRLPSTGGGCAVSLLIVGALVGGGWLLVRRFSSSK